MSHIEHFKTLKDLLHKNKLRRENLDGRQKSN